jgi:hypothetical protein
MSKRVIGILIAGSLIILGGFFFLPHESPSLRLAEITKAQSTVNTLAVAFRAYFTEYGHWPSTSGEIMMVNSNVLNLLTGVDVVDLNGGKDLLRGNPRKLSFFEYKKTDLDAAGNLVDPWRNPYFFKVDATYVNSITNPFIATPTLIPQGVIVWSAGPDGKFSSTAGEKVGVNKDNIKSW